MIFQATIFGLPVSQKNAKRIVPNRKTRRPFIMSDPKVIAWKREAIRQLKEQWKGATHTQPLRAELVCYQGARQRIDADNLAAAPFDALQQAGVIANDYQIKEFTLKRERDADIPRIEITLFNLEEEQQ